MRCSNCNADNRYSAKFCDSCGAALHNVSAAIIEKGTRSRSLTGERRHLSVLFCDLVDSTSIAAKLDPEEWRELAADYQRTTARAVERFGGRVAKYLGDGVMAYFGWPEAHGDDAERAVRSGLAIVEGIAKLNGELTDVTLSARVGNRFGSSSHWHGW